jgi:hypothetical protein
MLTVQNGHDAMIKVLLDLGPTRIPMTDLGKHHCPGPWSLSMKMVVKVLLEKEAIQNPDSWMIKHESKTEAANTVASPKGRSFPQPARTFPRMSIRPRKR